MPPPRRRAPGLRVFQLRLRRQSHPAVLGAAQRRPPAVAVRRHQEGERADGAQLQPPLRASRHRAAVLHRLRTLGPARHGAVRVHPQHSRRPSHRRVQPGPPSPGLHLRRRHRRRRGARPRPARVRERALARGVARSGHQRGAAPDLQHRQQSLGAARTLHRGARGVPGTQGEEEHPAPATRRRARHLGGCRRSGEGVRLPAEHPVEVGVRRFVDWYREFYGAR